MFAVSDMGLEFYKLVQAKDSDLREDIVDYDGDDTDLLEHYVLATDDCEYVSCEAQTLGLVHIVHVDAVAVIGESTGGVRCYAKKIAVCKDTDGNIWMDAALEDEVFA
jgi:hypothetical protein